MIDEKTKRNIDNLSKDEIRLEINKKNRSRFQNDGYAYLVTRMAALDDEERATANQQESKFQSETLAVAKEANEISRGANRLSAFAIVISILAIIIAGAALYIDLPGF